MGSSNNRSGYRKIALPGLETEQAAHGRATANTPPRREAVEGLRFACTQDNKLGTGRDSNPCHLFGNQVNPSVMCLDMLFYEPRSSMAFDEGAPAGAEELGREKGDMLLIPVSRAKVECPLFPFPFFPFRISCSANKKRVMSRTGFVAWSLFADCLGAYTAVLSARPNPRQMG